MAGLATSHRPVVMASWELVAEEALELSNSRLLG